MFEILFFLEGLCVEFCLVLLFFIRLLVRLGGKFKSGWCGLFLGFMELVRFGEIVYEEGGLGREKRKNVVGR